MSPFSYRRNFDKKKDYFPEWFRQFRTITGDLTNKHPAPFPYGLTYKLVMMFSFWGNTVLGPFCGTGTTMLAAVQSDRNCIGIEIDKKYCAMTLDRLRFEHCGLIDESKIEFPEIDAVDRLKVSED